MYKPQKLNKMENPEKIQFLQSVLSDLGQEVISRRDPEYLYTSAYVAASGAVVWGVATLTSIKKEEVLVPAIIGAVFIVVLGFFICLKISREYNQYKKARSEQGRLATLLIDELKVKEKLLPNGIVNSTPQKGHLYSLYIVIAAGVGAAAFCISLI